MPAVRIPRCLERPGPGAYVRRAVAIRFPLPSMRRLLLLALATLPLAAQAQSVGTCARGTATADLASNAVQARLFNTGGLFWRGAQPLYRVPVGPTGQPPAPNAIFAATLWVGGVADGQLRMSAADYSNWELWPGPLDDGGILPNAADCTPYDRIWRVSRADVRHAYAGGTPSSDLRDWPVGLGAPTFVDANRNTVRDAGEALVTPTGRAQRLDLAAGEAPLVLGEQTAWWVMNDVGNRKNATGTTPIGLEVRVEAFAMPSADAAIDQTTVYRYTFVNRSTKTLADAYAGMWTDAEVGYRRDDYMGTDSARSLVYTYNSDNDDEGESGYGTPPPAFGLRVLGGPLVAAPGRTWTDPDGTVHADRRRLPLTASRTFDDISGDAYARFYSALQGRRSNGEPMRACGNGSGPAHPACPVTVFAYGGDPVTGQGWTPSGSRIVPDDRQMLASAGPFTLAPGEAQTFTFAYVYARGTSHLGSVTALREASDRVQAAWDGGAFLRGTDGATLPALATAPALPAPANLATAQPTPTRLLWQAPGDGVTAYDLQVGHDAAFADAATHTVRVTSARYALTPDSTGRPYVWRVRAVATRSTGAEVVGPWSQAWTFTSTPRTVAAPAYRLEFQTVANAAGSISPPEPAALGSAGFPVPAGRLDPDGTRQQSTGGLRSDQGWAIHTFGSYRDYTGWYSRALRDGANEWEALSASYEWRFTGSSVGVRWFDGGTPSAMTVPFELWSLGADVASRADDVRMIPLLGETLSGRPANGTFDIGGDSPLSPGADDPISDAVYWYYPDDRTPGQVGYAAFERTVASSDPLQHVGDEVWARTALVGVNFGASAYPIGLPEPGTVFRILRTFEAGSAPALASPSDGSAITGPTATLRWTGGMQTGLGFRHPTPAGVEVQLARDAAFTDLVRHDTVSADPYVTPFVVSLPASGRYHWRVRHLWSREAVAWSAAWAFTVGTGTTVDAADAPLALTLSPARPNPARGTARMRVGMPPSGGAARVDVFDVLGRRVAVAHDGVLPSGWSEVAVETSSWAPGVYVVRLTSGREARTQTFVVAR